MSETVSAILANADYFILLLFRMGGLVVTSPIFGRVQVPNTVKVSFAVAVTMLAFHYYPPVADIAYSSLLGFFMVCLGELLIGLALAFVTNMFFTLVFTGGQLIDMQIGFGIVNVYDPQNNTQVPMTGNIMNILMLIVFWGVNGHFKLLDILFGTLTTLPVGNVHMSPEIGTVMLEVFSKTFTLGVMVGLPIIASGLIIEICFGALMRTVPQLNMFVVGMPIKLLIGLLLLALTLPVFVTFSSSIFDQMYQSLDLVFSAFYTG